MLWLLHYRASERVSHFMLLLLLILLLCCLPPLATLCAYLANSTFLMERYVMGSMPWAPCHGIYVMGSMPWALCHGVYAMGSMPRALCHRLYVTGSMSWGLCHGLYVRGSMSWALCHGQDLDLWRVFSVCLCSLKKCLLNSLNFVQ